MNDEIFVSYLKMIQKIINRMAKNSFQIKAWAATIFVATIVLTYSIINTLIFLVLIFVIILLWALDSYYLKQERLFRKLYEQKVSQYNNKAEKDNIILFDMDVSVYKVKSVVRTMISISELLYYIAIIGTLIVFLLTYLTMNWAVLTSTIKS